MRNRLLLSLLSATLLSAGWLCPGGLLLAGALIPLLLVSGRASASRGDFWKTALWVALSFGLWSAATTWWVWLAAPIGAIFSVIITITLMGGAFMLYHYCSKRVPKPLAYTILVCGWIAAEYLYTVGELSFPWLTLGNGFADNIKLIQWYDTTGVFGGTLWVLLCNILIYTAISNYKRITVFAAAFCFVTPILISLIKYHTFFNLSKTYTSVAVIQPNLFEKHTISAYEQAEIIKNQALQSPQNTDFIIAPETALSNLINEDLLDSDNRILALRESLTAIHPGATLVTGATTWRGYITGQQTYTARGNDKEGWYDVFNSVITIDSTASGHVRHKSLLVLGAEKIPFYSLFKNLQFLIVDLGGITGQLGYDPAPVVFRSPKGVVYGAAICYEGVYGEYMSGFVTLGAQILFIISNDQWWGNTQGYRRLFSLARIRAVELRRSIARSANTGISGLITPRGDVLNSMEWDTQGTLCDKLPLNGKITFYARHGDYIGRIACFTFALCLLYVIALRFKKR